MTRCVPCAVLALSLVSRAAAAPRIEQIVASMKGSWTGSRNLGRQVEVIQFFVTPGNVTLEVESGTNSGQVTLSPKKLEKDGSVSFTFPPQKPAAGVQGNHPALTTGRVNASLEIASTGLVRVFLKFPDAADSKFNAPTVVATQPAIPGAQPQRIFLERFPSQHYAYSDWRSREQVEATPDELLRRLVRNGIGRCVAQADVVVNSGQTATTKFKHPGGTMGYMIYAASGDPELTYAFASSPPVNALVRGETNNYPVVMVAPAGFFSAEVTVSLRLNGSGAAAKRVPVTILALGGANSYGPGCPMVDGR